LPHQQGYDRIAAHTATTASFAMCWKFKLNHGVLVVDELQHTSSAAPPEPPQAGSHSLLPLTLQATCHLPQLGCWWYPLLPLALPLLLQTLGPLSRSCTALDCYWGPSTAYLLCG